MQSHLEAALLGHSNLSHDDDDNNFHEEETEDTEEFDEEAEDTLKNHNRQVVGKESNRTVTLQNLLSTGILTPAPGAMTIEYLGQKFVGDLLEDGKIRSQETDIVFASPSAWAIACKRFINPEKKSGCGWASVKYKGKKLDAYKGVWYKKKKEEEEKQEITESRATPEQQQVPMNMANSIMYQRVVVKHNTIANRTLTHDANTMIDCVPFSNLGRIQPFLVSLSTNAALLMDFHCHLTKSEVSGYLAGQWDVNAHNLQITHAYPCRSTKADRDNAPQVEAEIAKAIDKEKLTLVGWYHSHPYAAAAPTLRDVDAQLDYQIKMKGTSDNSYIPCIGIIVSPYNYANTSLESSIIAYWVIPPPETKPNEYGRPMLMSYSVIQDAVFTLNVKEEMKKTIDYYKKESDFINFTDAYLGATTFIDKLKTTLISKFPRDESETTLWQFIRESLGISTEDKEPSLLSIPNVSKSSATNTSQQLLPNLSTPVSLNSNLMLPSDISNILFSSGKFPSASSLLGLPDPMAHSTLAANNMFLQTNLFKMQELLKPLSSSSPLPNKSKAEANKTHTSTTTAMSSNMTMASNSLKIPTDDVVKGIMKHDFPHIDNNNIFGLKSKLDYAAKDFSVSDYISSLSKSGGSGNSSKQEFSLPDLSMSKSLSDYSLNLSSKLSESGGEKMAKIPKMDYSGGNMLDLTSFGKNSVSETSEQQAAAAGENTSIITTSNSTEVEEKPLNLAGE